MSQKIKVAVLGSTGYVGLELINILSNHKNVLIKFLGSDSSFNKKINNFDNRILSKKVPILSKNSDINISEIDLVFLCLPHGISNKFVKKFYGKTSIIDLSADFRLDKINVYKRNYNNNHINKFPLDISELDKCKPIYEEFNGWDESTEGLKNYDELPANAKEYIKAIEDMVSVPVDIVSTGPDREQTIIRKNPFE